MSILSIFASIVLQMNNECQKKHIIRFFSFHIDNINESNVIEKKKFQKRDISSTIVIKHDVSKFVFFNDANQILQCINNFKENNS